MNQKHISKEEWLSKIRVLRESTEQLSNLPPDWLACNGWSLKELLIHLQAWDETYLCILEYQQRGESYIPQFCRFPDYNKENQMIFVDRWNNQIINKRKNLSLKEIRAHFIQTRQRVFKEFGELWSDEAGLQNPSIAIRIDDLSSHDTEHMAKSIKNVDDD